MELPIRVIITLFVTLIVAVSIIYFSTDIIERARANMANINGKEVPKNQVIEVETVTTQQIINLAEQCYEDKAGKILDKELCYVVKGHVTATKSQVKTAWNHEGNMTAIFTSPTAVFIYYNPSDDEILVTD